MRQLARRLRAVTWALAAAAVVAALAVGASAQSPPAPAAGADSGWAVRYAALAASSRQALQAALAYRGYYDGPIDGRIGPETRAALSAFQRSRGIAPSGLLDPASARALGLDVYAPIADAEPLSRSADRPPAPAKAPGSPPDW